MQLLQFMNASVLVAFVTAMEIFDTCFAFH